MDAGSFERAEIVGQPREHVAAVAPQILLGFCHASIRARRDLVGRGNRLIEREHGFSQLDAFARGFFRRHDEAHDIGIVEAQLRRALDRAVSGGHLGRALRMTAGGGFIQGRGGIEVRSR